MKLNGKITLLVDPEMTTVELTDEASGITFAEVHMTPAEFQQALSRLGRTSCSIDVKGLDKVGKKMEVESFAFTIPADLKSSKNYETLRNYAQEVLDKERPNEGWIADGYFGSRNSFYFDTDNNACARCTIRRWE